MVSSGNVSARIVSNRTVSQWSVSNWMLSHWVVSHWIFFENYFFVLLGAKRWTVVGALWIERWNSVWKCSTFCIQSKYFHVTHIQPLFQAFYVCVCFRTEHCVTLNKHKGKCVKVSFLTKDSNCEEIIGSISLCVYMHIVSGVIMPPWLKYSIVILFWLHNITT